MEVVASFRLFDAMGFGRFLLGRRGHESRFEWQVASEDVGGMATDEAVEVESLDAMDVGGTSDLLSHSYRLRPDLTVEFRLPTDLTSTEANRLAEFLKTLPFGA